MKRAYFFLVIVTTSLFLGACEKVIDVDLNSVNPKLVVQGNINQLPGPYFVTLNQSLNFDESNNFPPVQNAFVTISDNLGDVDTLTEVQSGVYATTHLQGIPGNTYTLSVNVAGEIYTSVSTMPQYVELQGLNFLNFTGPLGNQRMFTVPVFQDPAGQENFYRYILRVNHLTSESIFLLSDQDYDGQLNTRALRSFDPQIQSGDSVWVEMRCVDESVWNYFDGLRESGGGNPLNQPATPFTPSSPIQGENVIGYFSAHSVSVKETVVP